MKSINIYFEDEEYNQLIQKNKNYHGMISYFFFWI